MQSSGGYRGTNAVRSYRWLGFLRNGHTQGGSAREGGAAGADCSGVRTGEMERDSDEQQSGEQPSRRGRRRLQLGDASAGETNTQPVEPAKEEAAKEDTEEGGGSRRRRAKGGQPADNDENSQPTADASPAAAPASNNQRRRRGKPQPQVEAEAEPVERAPDVKMPSPQTQMAESNPVYDYDERERGLRAPPPMGSGLAEEERLLLATPLQLSRGDLYPTSVEPHFPMMPPAPMIGEVDASYVELPIENRFRRVSRQPGAPISAVGAGAPADARAEFTMAPTAATEAVALIIGLGIHLAQGALAGVSLMQAAAAPWPDDSRTPSGARSLVRPLAYADLALPLQRTLALLAGASFLASCDLHAAAPRYSTGAMLVLYAIVVITCVLELPTDVALHVGRGQRETALSAALTASFVNETDVTPAFYRPYNLPEAALETGGGFFSTALSIQQFSFFQGLIIVRAILTTIAWLLSSLVQSQPAFGVPPVDISDDPGLGYEYGGW